MMGERKIRKLGFGGGGGLTEAGRSVGTCFFGAGFRFKIGGFPKMLQDQKSSTYYLLQCHLENPSKIKARHSMRDHIRLIYASAVAPLIGRYCGTKIPPEIQSSSGLLSLSFHTDMAVAKDGFSARYNMTRKGVSDCEWQYRLLSVSLSPPLLCHLCSLTSSLPSSSTPLTPPDLSCSSCFNAISVSKCSP